MLLAEMIDAFKQKYKFECFKRDVPEKIINEKLIVLLFSEVVSDIQKTFDVVELSLDVPLTVGTDKYDLNASVMEPKTVAIGLNVLTRKSTEWFEKQIAQVGTPAFYTFLYLTAIPKIWIYPSPVSSADDLIINYVPNFNFYSPSSVPIGDFGDFLITNTKGYHGNTVFPTQYDKLMLLGLMKQMFPEIEPQYEREKNLLLVKQFNGEKFDYNPDWGDQPNA